MKKIFSILLMGIVSFGLLNAQELICEVTVSAPDASKVNTDPRVFKTLENSITEFMNNRKWTDESFKEHEKIQMSIFIGITEQSGDNGYSGSITVVTKRPVFNSNYNSTVLNIIDNDFAIVYKEFDPIEFNEFQFTSNLSHILGYYAYLSIGVDYDTYADLGGQKYLQIAQDMVNLVGTSEANAYKGWKSYDKNQRNRYWFITHLMNGRYEPFRKAMYIYHREGLDNFYDDPELARSKVMAGLNEVAKVSQDNPNLPLVQTWSESKLNEIVGVFSEAPAEEKTAFLALIKKADPTNANEYDRIKGSK
ncbi:DUF4835 family protein [Chitinophagales bacterium]|nr:DUF4835 family protein [Chitinophagales bacterium]